MLSFSKLIKRVYDTSKSQQIPSLLSSNNKRLITAVVGCVLGHQYARWLGKKHQKFQSQQHLTEYQNQDQINSIVTQTNKPAIIYYYTTYSIYHSIFRRLMIKYSNIYPQNATWVMVNVRKHFFKIAESINGKYPSDVMLEIRFPKCDYQMIFNNSQNITVNDFRRQLYSYGLNQNGFKSFLIYHGVIPNPDPIDIILNTTEKAIFNHD